MIWKTRRHTFNFHEEESKKGVLMGILNTTPDSFSDGGQYTKIADCVAAGLDMIAAGAHIIDIGGESTRPGAPVVVAEEEIKRTVPIIRALRKRSDVLISIDTSKAAVAASAIDAGADIVNDVTGLTGDSDMMSVCADSCCGVVAMHMRGNPRTMQNDPRYTNGVIKELQVFFEERLETLTRSGIERERICLDPGIGFGKTVEQNLTLIRQLGEIQEQLGRPFLLGVSRKSMIGELTGIDIPSDRDAATAMITAMSFQQGIFLHRIHNVSMNAQALRVADSIRFV